MVGEVRPLRVGQELEIRSSAKGSKHPRLALKDRDCPLEVWSVRTPSRVSRHSRRMSDRRRGFRRSPPPDKSSLQRKRGVPMSLAGPYMPGYHSVGETSRSAWDGPFVACDPSSRASYFASGWEGGLTQSWWTSQEFGRADITEVPQPVKTGHIPVDIGCGR